MKNIIFLFMLFLAIPAYADVYVVTAQDGSIHSLSEQDDAVVPSGYLKDVIKNKMLGDLPIDGDISLYKYSGKKFSLDGKKVSDRRKAEEAALLKAEKVKNDCTSAISKLEALGLTKDEINALLGR